MLTLVCGLFGVACGSAPDQDFGAVDGDISEAVQGIWESTCNENSADFNGTGSINHNTNSSYTHASPQCAGTWIAQVNSFVPPPGFSGVVVKDIGPTVSNQAECENLWMAAQLFLWNSPTKSWIKLTSDGDSNYRHNGQWVGGKCRQQIAFRPLDMEANSTYRIHASARSSRYGYTRKMQYFSSFVLF